MVARAHGNTLAVEDGADVVRVDAVDHEGDDARLPCRRADDADFGNRVEQRGCVLEEVRFVALDVVHAQFGDVVDRGGEANRARDVGCARLEAFGDRRERRRFEGDELDHAAAGLVGGHPFEKLAPSIEHADSTGSVEFVAREGVEVRTEFGDIDGEPGHGLCAIDEHRHAAIMGDSDDVPDRDVGADGVRHVRGGHDAGAVGEEPGEALEIEGASVVDRGDPQGRSLLEAELLPRHEVGVVLECGNQDLVALAHVRPAERECNEVDRLRSVSHEDDLVGARCAHEAGDRFACLLVEPCCALGEFVDAAVDVGVVVRVEARDGIDHGLRLLRAGGGIEVDQRLVPHGRLEDREVLADERGVEAHDAVPRAMRSLKSAVRASASASPGSALRISPAKPRVSKARASRSPIARALR